MRSTAALNLSMVLLLFVGICGCATAQRERQADIGPQTFPSSLPETTPSADRPNHYPGVGDTAQTSGPLPSASPVPSIGHRTGFGL